MRRTLLFLTALVAAFTSLHGMPIPSFRDPPSSAPTGGATGWGMSNEPWEEISGTWNEWGIWEPGHDWVVDYNEDGTPVYIEPVSIKIELWVDIQATMSYEYTTYQYHRLGDQAETLEFTIQGTVKTNTPVWVGWSEEGSGLDKLHFRHDIFGNTYEDRDLPIRWQARWGRSTNYGTQVVQPWTSITPNLHGSLYISVNEACDHWFQFRGAVDLPYHIPAGYYSLTLSGCPVPEL